MLIIPSRVLFFFTWCRVHPFAGLIGSVDFSPHLPQVCKTVEVSRRGVLRTSLLLLILSLLDKDYVLLHGRQPRKHHLTTLSDDTSLIPCTITLFLSLVSFFISHHFMSIDHSLESLTKSPLCSTVIRILIYSSS